MINTRNANELYATLESVNSRKIILPKLMETAGVESDENVRTLKFKFPKEVDGMDLTQMQVRINYMNSRGEKGQHIADDLKPFESDDNYVTFSWSFSRMVTRYRGVTKFVVCAVKAGEDGDILTEWNTALAQIRVLEGLEVTAQDMTPDEENVIAQLISTVEKGAKRAETAAKAAEDTSEKVMKVIPNGGTAKQVLTKNSDNDGDYSWKTPESVVEVDPTLTQKGKAADAGAVGEFVSRFTYENAADITADLEWTRGYYSGGNLGDFKDSELTRTSILEAKAGEKFIVTGYPYYKCLLYFIVEGEDVTKRYPESGQSKQSNVKIECESDCKIYFGSDTNKLSSFKVEKIKKEFKDIIFSHDVEVTDYEDITSEISFAEGGYYKFSDLSYVDDPSSESAVINCAAGEMYRISGRSYYNMKNVVVSSGTKRIVHYPVKYGEQYSVNEFVVPESADKLYLARRTSETDIFKIEKIKSVLRKPKSGIEMANKSDNPLYGKTAVFDGDSICAGKTSDYHTNGFGYAGRIGVKNCMNWINYGIGGGTITSGTKDSSEKDRHWVSTNIAKIKEEYPNADYLILESCLNDGFNKLPVDELSEGYDEEYDPTRFTGAVEYMLKSALTLFPSAKIGVVIPHRVSIDLNKWHDVVRAACKKWNVPYIDLYYLSGINVNVEEQNKIMFSDGVTHLTAEAYERISAQIEKWMRTL